MFSLKNIRFAPVNLNYDRDRLYQEITSLRKHFKAIPAHKRWARPHDKIFVGTQEEIDQVTVVDDHRQMITKKLPSWVGISITHLPDDAWSKVGNNAIRNSSTRAWEWRDDLSSPYLREIAESLEFEELHSVRVMILPANSIGLVHIDSAGDYYENNVSLTLNVKNGGSPIIFLENDKTYTAENETAFLFRDDCYHGVPRVKENRVQVRINGRPNKKILTELIDLNHTVLVS